MATITIRFDRSKKYLNERAILTAESQGIAVDQVVDTADLSSAARAVLLGGDYTFAGRYYVITTPLGPIWLAADAESLNAGQLSQLIEQASAAQLARQADERAARVARIMTQLDAGELFNKSGKVLR